jgi:mono/diheme cytochrome c family protein
MVRFVLLCLASGLLLSACSRDDGVTSTDDPGFGTDPIMSLERMNRGAALYQEHCAQCHGPEAQGHPDWENTQVVAAPPLNGTGNEWKRSHKQLMVVISDGLQRKGTEVMPGWKGRLKDEEIEDIILWFQALWPKEVFDKWQKANVPESQPKG